MNRHTSRFTPVGVFVTLCLSAAMAIPLAVSAASVSGTVRDAVTLDPVPGFEITLHVINPDSVALQTTSGPGGVYAISGAPDGNEIYVLVGYGPVYANYYARLPVPDPDLVFDVLLDSLYTPDPGDPPDSSAVFGRVMAETGGGTQGVQGAMVTLSTGGSSYVGVTDGDGQYSMILPPGTYSAEVTAAGFIPVSDSGLEVEQGGFSYNAFLTQSTTDAPPPVAGAILGIRAIRPNPLRMSAEVHYVLATAGHIDLAVYDLMGREVSRVVSGWNAAGPHVARFSAARLPAGLYFCRLQAAAREVSRRFAILP
jgi:hypothetical protein